MFFRPPTLNRDLEVPMELFYRGDAQPTYDVTQDDDGRGSDTQVLPFQAYGALGMSHPDEETTGKGAKFFFVKYDQGLLPPGRNTLDGAYTCFGYAVGGTDQAIKTLKPGDTIEKVTILSGFENLKNGELKEQKK